MRSHLVALILMSLVSTSNSAEWTEPDGTKVSSTSGRPLSISRDGKWRALAYGFDYEIGTSGGVSRGSSSAVELIREEKSSSPRRVWRSLSKNAPHIVLGDPRHAQFSPRNDFFVTAVRNGAGHQPYVLALVAVRLPDGRIKNVSTERVSKDFVVTETGRVVFDVYDGWPELGSAKRIATREVDLHELFKSPKR